MLNHILPGLLGKGQISKMDGPKPNYVAHRNKCSFPVANVLLVQNLIDWDPSEAKQRPVIAPRNTWYNRPDPPP